MRVNLWIKDAQLNKCQLENVKLKKEMQMKKKVTFAKGITPIVIVFLSELLIILTLNWSTIKKSPPVDSKGSITSIIKAYKVHKIEPFLFYDYFLLRMLHVKFRFNLDTWLNFESIIINEQQIIVIKY